MSKALLQSSVKPKLIYRLVRGHRSVEVWTTTCIVTNFFHTTPTSSACCRTLINPANPQLSGVRNFPYFPRGGPVPAVAVKSSMHKDWQPLGFVSQWGGMEVGSGMLYPVSVVDGLVHQLGGWRLEAECRLKQQKAVVFGGNTDDACPVGEAIVTSAGSDLLRDFYDTIVHTVPPFFKFDDNPKEGLQSCYRNALQLAFESSTENNRVATPLLGAGARGFPVNDAIQVAAAATKEWCAAAAAANQDGAVKQREQAVLFGLLEETHADQLASILAEEDTQFT